MSENVNIFVDILLFSRIWYHRFREVAHPEISMLLTHQNVLIVCTWTCRSIHAYPKFASIWNGGCAVNKLLYNPPSKLPSWSGSTKLNKCFTILYACSLLWRRAQRAIFHVVDHPGPSSPVLYFKICSDYFNFCLKNPFSNAIPFFHK